MTRPSEQVDRTRPTVEAKRAEVRAFWEVVRGVEKNLEQHHHRVVDHFKYGVRKLCAVAIWGRIQSLTEAPSQEALAARLDVSPAVVSRGLSEGALSLENLIVILTELRREFAVIDPVVPSRAALAVAGYQEAMYRVRFPAGGRGGGGGPSREQFCCLRGLYEAPLWFEAYAATAAEAPGGEAARRLTAATLRVRQAAERLYGNPVSLTEPADYVRLLAEWGDAYWTCFVAVAYQWLDDVHGA